MFSKSLGLKWYIFLALTNKKLLLPIQWKLKQIFLLVLEKLNEYLASPVYVVSSNTCIGPLPRIKISLFLSSICKDELMSTPTIMTFLPMLLSGNEYSEHESNPLL